MTRLLDHWWLILAVWVVLSFIVGPLVLRNSDLDVHKLVNDPPPRPGPTEAVAKALTAASEAVTEHVAVAGIAKAPTAASEAVAEHSKFPGRGGDELALDTTGSQLPAACRGTGPPPRWRKETHMTDFDPVAYAPIPEGQ
jgi:hypothetical protein